MLAQGNCQTDIFFDSDHPGKSCGKFPLYFEFSSIIGGIPILLKVYPRLILFSDTTWH